MATSATTTVVRGHAWSTLRLMRLARLVLFAVSVLFLLAVVSAVTAHHAALRTMGRDTVPSIVAAQHIRSAMADMDADATEELLSSDNTQDLAQAYETRRVETARALIGAAENITYGDAERLPLQSLQVGLGTYERLIQRARDVHSNDHNAAMAAYSEAADVMDHVLLPSAEALDKANDDVLEKTYASESFRSSGSRFLVAVMTFALLGSLLAVQVLLSQRVHRTLNPPLLLATLLVVVLGFFTLSSITRAHDALRTGKEDAFTSIHVLWRARAAATIARADESRFLLNGGHSSVAAQSYSSNADAVARWPGELTPAQLLAALREGRTVDGFSGYLADEVNNVTFPGEREASLATLDDWQHFTMLHNRLVQLENNGQPQRALELCTGTAPGTETWSFRRFDGALEQTLVINQNAFEAATRAGQNALDYLPLETALGIVAVIVLVFVGFAPRLREYR